MVTVWTSSAIRFVFGFCIGLLWATLVLRVPFRQAIAPAFIGALFGTLIFNFIIYYE